MPEPHSDAVVLFGATGDLAYEQIFPALQAMTRRGHLDILARLSGGAAHAKLLGVSNETGSLA